MNITYNCSFINGTHFNSQEQCDYDYNYDTFWQTLIFMALMIWLFYCVCCRHNREISIVGVTRRHNQIIVQQIEPNYSDFIISLDEQLEDSICVICFEELEEEVVRLENCEHKFHKKCIKTWLKEKPICPTCRTEIY